MSSVHVCLRVCIMPRPEPCEARLRLTFAAEGGGDLNIQAGKLVSSQEVVQQQQRITVLECHGDTRCGGGRIDLHLTPIRSGTRAHLLLFGAVLGRRLHTLSLHFCAVYQPCVCVYPVLFYN